MSRPMADTLKRRPRRQFTDEFKASAVRLVLVGGRQSARPFADPICSPKALSVTYRRGAKATFEIAGKVD